MQDDTRIQGQPLTQSSARRHMDFAPIRNASRTTAPLPTDRELERRKLARQEMARREAIKKQIEEQNRLKTLNQRRIDAAKLELSEYQAAEEARNRALEGERQRIIERRRQAQREAAEQMTARRKDIELEAKKRFQEEQLRKERALQEMQRREEASKITVTKRTTPKPRQTSPFFAPQKPQTVSTQNESQLKAQAASTKNEPQLKTQTVSAQNEPRLKAQTVSNALSPQSVLRSAGDTKVLASSRIQVIASPSRKLFGRIRPAGPARQTTDQSLETNSAHFQKHQISQNAKAPQSFQISQNSENTQSFQNFKTSQSSQIPQTSRQLQQSQNRRQPSHIFDELDGEFFDEQIESEFGSSINIRRSTSAQSIRPAQLKQAKKAVEEDVDDLEELLITAFDEPTTVKATTHSNSSTVKSNSATEKSATLAPDTSENNMNYVLGGRSPFINTDKVVKRPLSDSTREKANLRAEEPEISSESPMKPRKNVYAKRDRNKKSTKKTTTMIVEDRPKGIGISLAIAITLMIILGTIVGAFVYFAFFQ